MKRIARNEHHSEPATKSRDRSPLDLYKPRARSRITNGRGLLPDTDHRRAWVRRFRDVLSLHINSGARAGEATPLQFENYQRGSNTLRRLLESLASGLDRRAKEVTYDQVAEDVQRLKDCGFIDALNEHDGAAP